MEPMAATMASFDLLSDRVPLISATKLGLRTGFGLGSAIPRNEVPRLGGQGSHNRNQ
jgi:hypothetical protein